MKVLVVSVHPDDETLGCGGTLLKHKSNGDVLAWLIITNVSTNYGYSQERVNSRNIEIAQVAKLYQFYKTYDLGFKPTGLNSENQPLLIDSINKVFEEFEPELIYLINRSDAHSDHRNAFNACYACTKTFRYPFIKRVLMYECISETEFSAPLIENTFIPNYFVDITSFIEQKIFIMKIYNSELGIHPFPRNIENIYSLAKYRGAISGVNYAEAFQLLKYIDK